MHHPGNAKQCAICINHRRTVVREVAGALKEIEHRNDIPPSGKLTECICDWPGNGFRKTGYIPFRGLLRVKISEREFCKCDQLRTIPSGLFKIPDAPLQIVLLIPCRVLLNQGQFKLPWHGVLLFLEITAKKSMKDKDFEKRVQGE
jgi:hypothetical protein